MTTISKASMLLHRLLLFLVASFVIASIFIGAILNAYNAVWWWDDMLHSTSGILLGMVGLLLLYPFDSELAKRIRPLSAALFVFFFATAFSALWEIFEFSFDFFFQTSMQQYNMPPSAIVMGADYQGMGLRDTMGDIILGTAGALVASFFAHYAIKYHRELTNDVMRLAFPWVKMKKPRS